MRTESLKQVAVVMFCAFSVFGVHCADKVVTNKELGFEITFPEAWTLDEKPGPTAAVEGVPPNAKNEKTVPFVWVIVHFFPEGMNLKEIGDRYVEMRKKNFPDFVLADNSAFKLGDAGGTKLSYSYDPGKSLPEPDA